MKHLLLLPILTGLTMSAMAGGVTTPDESTIYFAQLSAGYSRTQSTPELKLQGGLSLSEAPVRWGYRFGLGVLAKPINHYVLGIEAALAQYTKNKWLFSPLVSSVEQDLKGVEILASVRRHLNSATTLALKGGASILRQKIKPMNVFNNPARFQFQHAGSSTKVRPILAVELSHHMTANTLAFINYSHVFGSRQATVVAASGPAPTLFANQSWNKAPSINNVMAGITVAFNA